MSLREEVWKGNALEHRNLGTSHSPLSFKGKMARCMELQPCLDPGDCFGHKVRDLEVIRLENRWQVYMGERNVDHNSEWAMRMVSPTQNAHCGVFLKIQI